MFLVIKKSFMSLWLEKDQKLVSNPNLDLVNAFNYLATYMLNYSSAKMLFAHCGKL